MFTKITDLDKKLCEAFSIYVLFSRYFILNRVAPHFYVKRLFWIHLMIEKESRNFFIWLNNHLWLLQGYLYPSSKNIFFRGRQVKIPFLKKTVFRVLEKVILTIALSLFFMNSRCLKRETFLHGSLFFRESRSSV